MTLYYYYPIMSRITVLINYKFYLFFYEILQKYIKKY